MTRCSSQWPPFLRLPAASLKSSRRRILGFALVSRFAILLAMVVSCAFIPDLNPGDDVLRFDLRFAEVDQKPLCFCLSGHACNPKSASETIISNGCADHKYISNDSSANNVIVAIYSLLLSPLTRWDAARFLTLAVDPRARHPGNVIQANKQCSLESDSCAEEMDPFISSEKAHAFFPLFPIMIRSIAQCFMWCIPRMLLPPTYEGVAVLAALILNALCFIAAAAALHDLTYTLTRRHTAATTNTPSMDQCLYLAELTTVIFCINPGSVFFSAGYSESLFAMLTFLGHACTARGYLTVAAIPWLAATYTRSNGTMASIWLFLMGISAFLSSIYETKFSVSRCFARPLLLFSVASFVAVPVFYHDRQGCNMHCASDLLLMPMWCGRIQETSRTFSLYGFVQRKHWNVGFLRYYEPKQIPNFLLAAPILFLSLSATIHWISCSWKRYVLDVTLVLDKKDKKEVPKLLWYNPVHAIQWAVFAFRSAFVPTSKSWDVDSVDAFLCGPFMLGHYAVLAACGLIGLIVAHVQVSTRLICSSCPAIYWYMAMRTASEEKSKNDRTFSRPVFLYCFGYIILGITMHVNWMPWT